MEIKIRKYMDRDPRGVRLVEGLPGIGLVGNMAVSYLIDTLNPPLYAKIYLPSLQNFVFVSHDSTISVPSLDFYLVNSSKKPLLLLYGEFQANTHLEQYRLTTVLLDFVSKLSPELIITLGGYSTPDVGNPPRVYYAVNHERLLSRFSGLRAIKMKGIISGQTGLIIGLARHIGIDGVCFLAETSGKVYPDLRAAKSLLEVLSEILEIKLDLSKLRK